MGIRGRLTLCFASLFSIIILALAVTAYWVERTQAYAKLDAALDVAIGTTAMSARHELNEHAAQAEGEADLQRVLEEAGDAGELRTTQILVEQDGRMAAYKSSDGDKNIRRLITNNVTTPRTVTGLRLASRELISPKYHAAYRIYAARPIGAIEQQIAQTRNLLLIAVSVGVTFATLIGHWAAGRALSPLRDFAQTLSDTTSAELSVRVQVRNPGDAIGQLGLRFNSLMQKLEYAFTLQRQFMADASHQIRTPVTVALVASQVIGRDQQAGSADLRQALRTVESQMLRLRRIVDDMFFLSQADTSPLKIDWRDLYLDDAIAEAARAASPLARKKGQTLHWGGLQEAKCRGDADLLTQALLILLDNAVKFTPEGSLISADICRRGSDWICSIVDNGPGIPESDQPRIFERFFQGHGAEAPGRTGAGLGLPIARSIVESHGGRLTLVESRPGMTRFEMAIPALDEGPSSATPSYANSSAVKI